MSRSREAFALNRPLSQSLDKLHFDYDKGTATARKGSESSSANPSASLQERYNISMMSSNSVSSSGPPEVSEEVSSGRVEDMPQEDTKITRLRERQQQRAILKSASDSTWKGKTRTVTSAHRSVDELRQTGTSLDTHKGKDDVISGRSQSGGWNSSTKQMTPGTSSHKSTLGTESANKTLTSDSHTSSTSTMARTNSARKDRIHGRSHSGSSSSTSGTTGSAKTPTQTKKIVPSVYARRPSSQPGNNTPHTPHGTPPVVTSKSLRKRSMANTPVEGPTHNRTTKSAVAGPRGETPSGSSNSQRSASTRQVVKASGGNKRPSGIPTTSLTSTTTSTGTSGRQGRPLDTKNHKTRAGSKPGNGLEDCEIPPPAPTAELSPIRPATNPFGDLINRTPPPTTRDT